MEESKEQTTATLPRNNTITEIMHLAESNRDHVEGQINLADTKAQLALIADALFGSYIFTLDKNTLTTLTDGHSMFFVRLGAASGLAAIITLFLSILFAILVAVPSLNQSSTSLFYFGDISRRSEVQFIHDFTELTSTQLQTMLLSSLYAKSVIVERKFRVVRWSLLFIILTLILLIINRGIQLIP